MTSDRGGSGFPYEELLEELRDLTERSFLDCPTRFALALTSSAFHGRLWPDIKRIYNPYVILDECARLGYFDLLQYAVERGAEVDVAVVEAAVKGNRTQLTLHVTSKFRLLLFQESTQLYYYSGQVISVVVSCRITLLIAQI